MTVKTVCVYCGSSNHVDESYKIAAENLGKFLAENDINLVYGGGQVGLMGIVADSVLNHNGKVTGIIPEFLHQRERKHNGLTELLVVDDMHTRKNMMAEKADAFIVMPGGFGTMDETFEILTWKQLGLHTKPIVIFNLGGFWDPAIQQIANVINSGFAMKTDETLFSVAYNTDDILEAFKKPEPPPSDPSKKWD